MEWFKKYSFLYNILGYFVNAIAIADHVGNLLGLPVQS